ncbi:methyltransferase-like 22 [Elysia marginata]|uniref:Methyltransferase-like 22 n=1 Tax=Elysia marginata TaxID=1093978 RepID=A0AAV4F6L6_9GAST|nr:methyltransferase-like 22 [Elysia marginata]
METSLEDVGYQLWAGALLLCDYLLHYGDSIQLQAKHSGILDLGAGLGITSIVAAMFASWVICTDYRVDILAQAESNWHRNKWLLPQVKCEDVLFKVLDWNCGDNFHIADKNNSNKYAFEESHKQILHSTNTILAAEVVYDEDLTDAFFKTIYHLLLYPPAKNVLVTLEKRIVFRAENLDVCSPAYEHFHKNLDDLVTVDEGPVRFCAEQISTSFPQYFQYTRTKEMVSFK